ncbi:MAG: serine--tRNA ligase, partial [Oleibacter sp.]|nr:serine--tRNA ligase [Thalassolituus sp.]
MLDVKFIRENLEQVTSALGKKGFTFDGAEFNRLDEQRKSALTRAQSLQAEKKKASKQIGQLIGQGMSPEDAKAQVMGSIDSDITEAEQQAKEAELALQQLLMSIPNVPDESVPFGKDEDDNIEVL